MKTSKLILSALIGGTAAFSAVDSAHATASLQLIVGADVLTIPDGSSGDKNSDPGAVTWTGTFDGFSITFAGGTTKPALGSATSPSMDIGTFLVSGGSGTLTLRFSDNGFGPTSGTAHALITGSTTGTQTITFNTYGGSSNTLFDLGQPLTSLGPLSGVISSSASGGNLNLAGPYELTEELIVSGEGSSSLDARLSVPDGGTTVALLGLALVGVEGVRRKFGQRKAPVA